MSKLTQARVNSSILRVALAGNPNSGKTTLFNALTGHRHRVGNYPGTTVERRSGRLHTQNQNIDLIDLPGAYSLAARSADEAIVLDALTGDDNDSAPDVIVNVVDATNLNRHLFLTSQLLELGKPVVVALNMSDLAESAGLRIDAQALARELGAPVVPVVAVSRKGVNDLALAIGRATTLPAPPRHPEFSRTVEQSLASLKSAAPDADRAALLHALLSPAGPFEERLVRLHGSTFDEALVRVRRTIADAGESLAEVEARARYAWVDRILRECVGTRKQTVRSLGERCDRVLTHPVAGMLILLVLMAGIFQSIYAWAGPLMDAIDGGFGWIGHGVAAFIPEGALRSLLVDGVVAGVGAVLTFLPQIVILFLFIALVEDCGYLARAAFLLDRWMRLFGLNGKAFIPLLSSFACAVPGIMATRVIEERRDRFIAMMIAPLMSCSARLPVYTVMIGAFVPAHALLGGVLNLQAVTLLAMYLVGVVVAIPVTWILQRTLLKGERQPFLMELPPYRWPSLRTVFYRVFDQAKAFCASAGTMIFAVTVVIWALGYYPRPASLAADFEKQREAARAQAVAAGQPEPQDALGEIDRNEAGAYLRQSFLGRMGAFIEPAVRPLGWDWRLGTAAIASFPAREVVIATMGTLYNLGTDTDENSEGLRATLAAATWPDGRPVFNLAVALSIMVFFALCCQCGATLAAIRRETQSWRWPLFTFVYMTALAYVAALAIYQLTVRFI